MMKRVASVMWHNQKLIVYHGSYQGAFGAHTAVSLALCRPATDFGQGFYTTTHLHQARQWANEKVRKRVSRGIASTAAVYSFELGRDEVAALDGLGFTRANGDFWSFVTYCRRGATDHARSVMSASNGRANYDMVVGPVTLWPQRLTISDCDQISFHTDDAIKLLKPRLHLSASPRQTFG